MNFKNQLAKKLRKTKPKPYLKGSNREKKFHLPASFVYQSRHMQAKKDLAYFLLLKQGEAHLEWLYTEVSFLPI